MATESRFSLVWAAILLATATALGAFGTHALKPVLPAARFDSFEIGVTYQFLHALGLLGIGLLQNRYAESLALRWSSRLILVGLLLFSGSIYALTFGAPRFFGMIAPFGGVSLMAAWVIFGFGVVKLPKS